MVWIRLCLSCIAFLSVAGSVSFGMIKLAERLLHVENPIMLLTIQKLAMLLYWIPVSFACVCIPRISYQNGTIGYYGEFVSATVPTMTVTFYVLGGIWFVGFLAAVVWAAVKQQKLVRLEKGNITVEESRYLDIFEQCREQFGFETEAVAVAQNDLLTSPITVGFLKKRILLPTVDYTGTELRMIYEHELTHIRNKDLGWRLLGLVTSWVHWFNPIIRRQQRVLACQQEIVCDLSTSIDNKYFTKKEYAVFLAKLTDHEAVCDYTLALTENKNQTIRRIAKMKETVKLDKPRKKVLCLSCACVAVFALIPTTAVSAKAAQLQEAWLRAEEVEVEDEPQDFSDTSIEEHGYADGSVAEIEEGLELAPRSTNVDLEKTISANTRYVYQYRDMSAGDSITIVANCEDSNITYKIGIKNKETGALTSISGSGDLMHEFKITKSGTYAAYVENCSNVSMNVTGVAVY